MAGAVEGLPPPPAEARAEPAMPMTKRVAGNVVADLPGLPHSCCKAGMAGAAWLGIQVWPRRPRHWRRCPPPPARPLRPRPTILDASKVSSIVIGRSSRADVFTALGRPTRTQQSLAGESWVYESRIDDSGRQRMVSGAAAASGVAGAFVPYLGLVGSGLGLANAVGGSGGREPDMMSMTVDFGVGGIVRDCTYASTAAPAGTPGAAQGPARPVNCQRPVAAAPFLIVSAGCIAAFDPSSFPALAALLAAAPSACGGRAARVGGSLGFPGAGRVHGRRRPCAAGRHPAGRPGRLPAPAQAGHRRAPALPQARLARRPRPETRARDGYQASDSIPIRTSLGPAVLQTYDFGDPPRRFGQLDPGDGGQVAFFTGTSASFGVTEDGGAGLQLFIGPGCAPVDGWVVVDRSFAEQPAGDMLARITRQPRLCPDRLGYAYTRLAGAARAIPHYLLRPLLAAPSCRPWCPSTSAVGPWRTPTTWSGSSSPKPWATPAGSAGRTCQRATGPRTGRKPPQWRHRSGASRDWGRPPPGRGSWWTAASGRRSCPPTTRRATRPAPGWTGCAALRRRGRCSCPNATKQRFNLEHYSTVFMQVFVLVLASRDGCRKPFTIHESL